MQHVGGADEHYVREIVFDVEIMIRESMIEFGIQHFHERRRRIAAEIHGHFVHFVENKHRIYGPGLLHHLNDLPRKSADIGAAMAANLGLISNSTQGDAHELTARSPADGHGQ